MNQIHSDKPGPSNQAETGQKARKSPVKHKNEVIMALHRYTLETVQIASIYM